MALFYKQTREDYMLKKASKIISSNGAQLYSITMISGDLEKTLYGESSTTCHNSYSVAKLFTVTAIGMLVDSGRLSVEDKIYDILKRHFPSEFDQKWTCVTIRDAMLHLMGITDGFLDIDKEDISSYGTDDFLKYSFSKKIDGEPGITFAYSDAAFYILSRVVSEISGENLCDFMMQRLFTPLKFQDVVWVKCPHGYSMGATGLYIRTCDMAKLGKVYLNGGMYNEKRIVSEEWANIVLENEYELKLYNEKTQSYCKGGMNGQMLCISKKNNNIVAWHAFNPSLCNENVLEILGF